METLGSSEAFVPLSKHLARQHENVERLLLVLESHLARALSSEEPDPELMLAILHYLTEYIDARHDPIEKLAFERLTHHAPWLGPLFEEHARQLDEVRAKRALFYALLDRGRSSFDRDQVTRGGFAFVAALRRRVVVEDKELLPAVSSVLDADDAHHIESRLRADGLEEFRARFAEIVLEAGCECEYA